MYNLMCLQGANQGAGTDGRTDGNEAGIGGGGGMGDGGGWWEQNKNEEWGRVRNGDSKGWGHWECEKVSLR